MKINYQLEFDKIIEEVKKLPIKPKILLHSCCGPCSTAVIEQLLPYFSITIFYYNPNVEPLDEYNHRKAEQLRLLKELNQENKIDFLDCDYDNPKYHQTVKGLEEEKEGGARCNVCFHLRMYETAKKAQAKQFDYFGTTLTVSPHKNSQIINAIGAKIEKELNIKYLYADFKKRSGYLRSIELAKKYDLYRQDYCGCLYAKNNID